MGNAGLLERAQHAATAYLAGEVDSARALIQAAVEAAGSEADRARLAEFSAFLDRCTSRREDTGPSPGIEAVTAALAGKETVDEIVEVLVLYTEQFPRCDAGFQMLGQTLMSLGRDAEAAKALIKSMSLNSSEAMTYQTLSMVLMTLGHFDWADACQAVADFLDGLSDFPELPATDGSPFTLELDRTLRLAKPTVSACLIVKDEAAVLEACLRSLDGLVDEVIVVDTGSTDQTVAIAASHGATVGHFTWIDDFSAARNASLDLAHSDWILVIDADETLVVDDPAAWKQALHLRKFGGYLLDQVNSFDDGHVDRRPTVRLFQRHPRIRYQGRLHEIVDPSLVALGLPFESLPAHFDHPGYMAAMMDDKQKLQRNLQVALAGAEREPDAVHTWFLMGLTAFEAGDFALACAAYERLLTMLTPAAAGELTLETIVMTYARALSKTGREHEVEPLLERTIPQASKAGALFRLREAFRREAGDTFGAELDRLAHEVEKGLADRREEAGARV